MTAADSTAEETPPQADEATVRKAVVASAMGNAIEWFDFGVLTAGAMTAIVGATYFEPGGSSTSAVLRSLGLVALAFIVRPFGGAFFGALGDKIGRKKILAMTIILMSGSTFLIGVLPGYASIGIWSTILLLAIRLVQGFSTGGEYGGAATFIAEYAPTRKRGKLGSFLEFGTLAGYATGAGVVLLMEVILGPDEFRDWGFRIPFIVALPLGLVGLYLRSRLEDTPAFQALEAKGEQAKSPLGQTLKRNWNMILNLIGIVFLVNVADYILLTTMPSYFTEFLKIGAKESGLLVIAVELVMMCAIVPLGALSDRIGRKPLMLTSAIGFVVLTFPAFKLMQSGNIVSLYIGFAIVAALLVCILAVIGSTFPAMFPTKARYGSFAIGYNISTSIFGGTAGVVTTGLIDLTGNNDIPAYYLILAGLVAIYPILKIPETARVPIHKVEEGGTLSGGQLPLEEPAR